METTTTPGQGGARSRAPVIALALAGAAVVLAAITAVIVLIRGGPEPAPPTATPGRALIEARVTTAALLPAVTGQPFDDDSGRVVVTDPAAFGLAAGDVIVSLGGRPARRASSLALALRALVRDQAPTLLWEIERGGAPVVVRVAIDGDLAQLASDVRTARAARAGLSGLSGLPGAPPGATPSGAGLDPVALVAGITKLDDTHYRITRALVEQVLANPMDVMKGARVVPSYSNGQTNGMKLYAIRPSSLFGLLGFANGDTVTRINGTAVDSMDRALDIYAQVRTAPVLAIELTRRGQPVELTIEIR